MANSASEVSLVWADNADNEGGIELERSLDGGTSWSLLTTLIADSTAYQDQGLTSETSFSYRVCATGQAGVSAYSNTATATTQAVPVYPPAVPSGLSAEARSQSEIFLAWRDNAADETGFDVERSQDGGLTWDRVASPGADVTSYSDQGLDAETFYLYRVRALGDSDASGYSNETGATTDAAPALTGCSVTGAATVKLNDRKFYWKLTNTGGTDVTIDRIEITWPAGQGKLIKLFLDREEIWRGSIASAPATIDSSWNIDVSRRQMNIGETREFRARFKTRFSGDLPSDYAVSVHFAEGCSVQF